MANDVGRLQSLIKELGSVKLAVFALVFFAIRELEWETPGHMWGSVAVGAAYLISVGLADFGKKGNPSAP
jgi:hypothetical protein